MAKKPKCKVCDREIDTRKYSHYKFGHDFVCYVEATEDCVVQYTGQHFREKGDGSGRLSGDDYE
jgi:hypothetical protein